MLKPFKRFVVCAQFAVFVCVASPTLAQQPPVDSSPSLPTGASDAWWSAVQKHIARSEYIISPQRTSTDGHEFAGGQAPNRAQNFRTHFSAAGILVEPRVNHAGEAPAWKWGLELAAWGSDGAMQPAIDLARVVTNGNRIEYQRNGITEWYINDERGLEQGFVVEDRPQVCDRRSALGQSTLRVEMAVQGDVRAFLATDAESVDFLAAGGARAIRFDGLKTVDATGRSLRCWFEICENPDHTQRLTIAVDDHGAVYPVTIDPLATSPVWTAGSNQAGTSLGVVASAGDVNGDGYSDVIVGAPTFASGGNFGRVWVYRGTATGVNVTASFSLGGSFAGGWFGTALATAGDINGDGYSDFVVGEPKVISQVNGTEDGRAHVFYGQASGVAIGPVLSHALNTFENFGASVASAGDVNGDGFSDIIVGAPKYSNGSGSEGAAIVYYGSAGGLNPVAAWQAESNQGGGGLGGSVASAGDVNGDGYSDVIVGASLFDTAVNGAEGAAFVWYGSAAGLGPSGTPANADWTAIGNIISEFGASVATAGDVNGDGFADVIIGAPNYITAGQARGLARVYHGSAVGLSATPAWSVISENVISGEEFGARLAPAGDVNGDGYCDVIVGAMMTNGGGNDRGSAYVFQGSSSELSATAMWTAEGTQDQSFFGASVSTAGDVNGDGLSDIIICAPGFDDDQVNEGRAYVYLGQQDGLKAINEWSGEGNQGNATFGAVVAPAGDVNGDGYGDVIIGALNYDNGQTDEGRAFVYHGSSTGLGAVANWSGESNQASAFFGGSVGGAGDVNGDGFADVVISASLYDNGQTNEGRVYVYHGSASGLGALPAWTAEGNAAGWQLGYAAAGAGDVNGDGFGDVIAGAIGFNNGQVQEGAAFLFLGSSGGLSAAPNWTGEGNQAGAFFGRSVASAGDVNGDGFGDVIVGAPQHDNGQFDEGLAYVFAGSASGLNAAPMWTAESDGATAWYGRIVASAGDVNGDGFADVIVGAGLYDNGQGGEGAAFVYLGHAGSGRTVLPRQTRTDGSTLIAPLGKSDSETEFRIRANLPSIYGRTRLGLQHEVKPLGTLFDGTGLVQDSLADTGADGAHDANALVNGLSAGTVYHWRVRARYDLVKTPLQKYGPWIHMPTSGWNEADLRTGGVPANPCPADITGGSGEVDVDDLLLLINSWGPCANPKNCPADVNGDDFVDIDDLLGVINSWGACP